MNGSTNVRVLPIVGAAMLIASITYAVVGVFLRPIVIGDGQPAFAEMPIPMSLIFLLMSVPMFLIALIIPNLPAMRPRGFRQGVTGLERDPDDVQAAQHGVDTLTVYVQRVVPLMIAAFAIAEAIAVFGLLGVLLDTTPTVGYALCGVGALTILTQLVLAFGIVNRAAELDKLTAEPSE